MLQPLPLASMLDFSHSPDVKESLSLLGCFSEDIVPVKLWDLVCPWEEVSQDLPMSILDHFPACNHQSF